MALLSRLSLSFSLTLSPSNGNNHCCKSLSSSSLLVDYTAKVLSFFLSFSISLSLIVYLFFLFFFFLFAGQSPVWSFLPVISFLLNFSRTHSPSIYISLCLSLSIDVCVCICGCGHQQVVRARYNLARN